MVWRIEVLSGPNLVGVQTELIPGQQLTVGRTFGSDWQFPEDLRMSSKHFLVSCDQTGCSLEDLDSTNGTLLNGSAIRTAKLADGDEIRAGSSVFSIFHSGSGGAQLLESSSGVSDSSGKPVGYTPTRLMLECFTGESREVLREAPLSVGRTHRADWSIPDDLKLSSEHFQLEWSRAGWQLVDLNSTNGTCLNGHRVTEARVHHGDLIQAGTTEFTVNMIEEDVGTNPHEDFLAPATQDHAEPFVVSTRYSEDVPILFDPVESPPATWSPKAPAASTWRRIMLQCQTNHALSVELFEGQSLLLGRSLGADVSIQNDSLVSSGHARINVLRDQIVLFDLESTNGTFVNNVRVMQHRLELGDELRIGKTCFSLAERESLNTLSENSKVAKRTDTPEPPSLPFYEPPAESDAKQPSHSDEEKQPSVVIAKAPEGPQPSYARKWVVQDQDLWFNDEVPYEAYPCGSGLYLYRGSSARFDPIDVLRRLLHASPAWLITETNVVNLEQGAIESDAKQLSVEPLAADDPSWMLPWQDQWGSNGSIIVYSRSDVDRIRSAFELLKRLGENETVHLPLDPLSISDFLANRMEHTVRRFFAPLDAVLVELADGKRWGYFAPRDIESTLKVLRFRKRRTW